MPVGSITLSVSHLPSAASFYLAVLQPFAYQFVEDIEGKIGFGQRGVADLYICQSLDRTPTSITLKAPSAGSIDTFFASALRYGAAARSCPTLKDCETGLYTASVLDLDGNTINVSCEEPAMSTYSIPTAYRTPDRISQRSQTEPVSSHDIGAGDGNFRVKIVTTTQHGSTPPPPEDQRGSGDGASTLFSTLLGVAAGAAFGYAVGRDKQAGQTIAQAVQAAPAAIRAIENVTSSQRAALTHPQTSPPLQRASTYHGELGVPFAIETPPSPPNEYHPRPSLSEASSYDSRKGSHPLMIAGPPSRSGASSFVTSRQILPPSPPSVHTVASSHHSRSLPPSPPRSSVSRSSKASSQRTVRPEDYALPVSTVESRISVASAARSAAVSGSKAPYKISLPPSTAGSKSSSKTSSNSRSSKSTAKVSSKAPSNAASRQPHQYPLPSSRATSSVGSKVPSVVSSRQPNEYSLPVSKATSITSASTVKPPRSVIGFEKDSDEESLGPEDSISQVSSNNHRVKKKVHRHRKRSDSGKDDRKRSLLSLPIRESKKERDVRGVSSMT